jgi:photosystem II stability/assembly factor-like uncharacterized protein
MRLLSATVLVSLASSLCAQQLPGDLFQALEWRFIGPFRGGRVLAATGVIGQPNVFYFGSVGGGVWKSGNAGLTWVPIFDANPIASIGAIEVAPSNPQVIYVGTGEADMRSDIGFGDGIYKSVDAGRTWTHAGLGDSMQIGRILVHPTNPDLVYVAALGHAYGPNEERGVYRSTDGGRIWKKVLNNGPEIGAVDLAFEPGNPRVLYATTWGARRPPWSQYAPLTGPGGGLYKSEDGGDTWQPLTGSGLPPGGTPFQRAGVAVGRTESGSRVYVLADALGGGLFRSDDGGHTFTRVSADPRITGRGWYFGGVTVDPENPDIVYVPNVALYWSRDGGKTFGVLKGAPGGDDYHSMWVDPTGSARMIFGSDQGVGVSVDGGKTWSSWYNQPTAQMYHVATDNQFPYWVYGSQQDSGTVALPSRSDRGTISEYDRRGVGGAESGWIAPDPKDSNIVYAGNAYGSLARFDKRTSQSQNITPWPVPEFRVEIAQRKYRFPWTAPLVFSPLEPDTLYYGAQVLLKSLDGGLHWSEISKDLTGDERKPGAPPAQGPVTVENAKARGYGVIYSIAPSPLRASLIWAGSDTGLIHVTRDAGKTWADVTPKKLSDWSKITHLEASRFDPGTAYAAVDRHRLDDYRPYAFRTRDYGKTWQRISGGIGDRAFLNAVREDPQRRGLLYAATELGVYVSFDDGDHWQSLQLNLPVSSVRDLVVHGSDLVIATHGRGFWILDNMTPLRQADWKISEAAAFLYKPERAVRILNDAFQGTPLPPEIPQASNPPSGAIIDYYLKSAAPECTLEILNASGQVVRRFSTAGAAPARRRTSAIADVWIKPPRRLTANQGMNRFVWDLRYAAAGIEGEEGTAVSPQVLPGRYTVRLTAAGVTLNETLEVTLDPRSKATPADLRAQFDLAMKAMREIERASELLTRNRGNAAVETRVNAARRDLTAVLEVATSADRTPPAQAYALFDGAVGELTAAGSR